MSTLLTVFLILGIYCVANTQVNSGINYVSETNGKGYLALKNKKGAIPLFISSTDFHGVIRAFKDLQSDIFKVSGENPELFFDKAPIQKSVIIAGTLGKSKLIDMLVSQKKIVY